MEKQKVTYLAPRIEVIEMENEGVIAASVTSGATGPTFGAGETLGNSASGTRSNMGDLEDMINDILTFE